MNEASDISGYPYVFTYGTFDPEYLNRMLSTRFDLDVITPVLRILLPASGSKVFMFEMNRLRFRPEPNVRDGVFDGHSYRIDKNGKRISFVLLLSSFYLYNGPKSLVFPEMSDPDFRDRLFIELSANGIPGFAAKIPEPV